MFLWALKRYWNANLPIKCSRLLKYASACPETCEAFIWEKRQKRFVKIDIWLSDNAALVSIVNSNFVNIPSNECPVGFFVFKTSYNRSHHNNKTHRISWFDLISRLLAKTTAHYGPFLSAPFSASLKVIITISPTIFPRWPLNSYEDLPAVSSDNAVNLHHTTSNLTALFKPLSQLASEAMSDNILQRV